MRTGCAAMQTRMRAISRFDRQAMELWPQILKDIESCAEIIAGSGATLIARSVLPGSFPE